MAERNGSLLRLLLRSADRFNERAMLRGSSRENTPESKSSALLFSVTWWDQRLILRVGMSFPLLHRAIAHSLLYGNFRHNIPREFDEPVE